MPSFPDRLKELRNAKGITQKQMAELFNMTERGFRGYEMGLSTPHYETLVKLADYFNISLDYLTGRSDTPERN
jgi:transcriptional regulator with XRE-family HTH domain